MKKFSNKVAVVTGGNSGIGYATAKELVAHGATVVITGRRREAVQKAASELAAIPLVSDQSVIADIESLVTATQETVGKVDILFINAGITGTGGLIAGAEENNFDSVMEINFKGAYFTLSKFIPILNDGASVIFLSSIASATHRVGSSVYQASKAALNSIAKTAAKELASRKIRVNMVSPGPTRTEIFSKLGLDAATVGAVQDALIQEIPLQRMGLPDEVASLVAYLCDEKAAFITGSEFVVDGGMLLK